MALTSSPDFPLLLPMAVSMTLQKWFKGVGFILVHDVKGSAHAPVVPFLSL